MRGVFLDLHSLDRDDLDLQGIKTSLEDWQLHETVLPDDVLKAISEAEVVVSNKVPLNEEVIRNSPQLKLICVAATGVNNVDIEAAKNNGVLVCNARDYATPSVVQHVFAMILSLSQRLKDYEQAVNNGDWGRSPYFCLLDFPITELTGKTMGIIGYGVLGKAVATMAKAFGMEVIIAERKGEELRAGRVAFEDVIRQADVLSLHCALMPETSHLIGVNELRSMKSSALLINAARGGVVDENALVDALEKNKIAGAGVDTLSQEPPVNSNPLLECSLTNLIVTPHIAWASRESRQRLLCEVEKNIAAYREGKERNRVV